MAGQARTEVKEAIDDRRSEYIGLALIVIGVLSGLAVYFKLAGPLGRGVSNLLGWLTGQGRYLIPIVLIAVGVAMIRKGEIRQRFRLALGVVLIAVAFLGLEHITRGSDNISLSLSALQRAGGWLGALVAEPLTSLIAPAGASVLLIAAALFGVLLITRKPLREAVGSIVGWTRAAARPVGAAARKAVGEVSTLSSERESGPIPSIYDAESEDAGGTRGPVASARAPCSRQRAAATGPLRRRALEPGRAPVGTRRPEGAVEAPARQLARHHRRAGDQQGRGRRADARWRIRWRRTGSRRGSSARPSGRPSPATSSSSDRA